VIDTQILASAITGLSGVAAGFLGGKYNSKHEADKKCERVCALMVNGFDKLLTALDVVGEPVEIKHVIRDARDTVSRAKALMGLDGGFDSQHNIK
jgi:hypothetical protein